MHNKTNRVEETGHHEDDDYHHHKHEHEHEHKHNSDFQAVKLMPSTHHQDHHDKSHCDDVQRRLKLASVLCFIVLLSEVTGGYISGSLAVLSDAAHLFGDFMGFVFAVAATYMASMPGSENYVSVSHQLLVIHNTFLFVGHINQEDFSYVI